MKAHAQSTPVDGNPGGGEATSHDLDTNGELVKCDGVRLDVRRLVEVQPLGIRVEARRIFWLRRLGTPFLVPFIIRKLGTRCICTRLRSNPSAAPCRREPSLAKRGHDGAGLAGRQLRQLAA